MQVACGVPADVVVLGAGPAGLGAAYRAARAGHRVVLLERSDRVGGLAGSFDVDGVRVDFGSHRLHPSTDPEILVELRRLLGPDLQLRRRNGRILLEGRWIGFPLRPADALRRLPPSFAAGVGRDLVTRPLRRPRGDTFAELLRAGLGPTMAERFYFPYARKLWGIDPEEISGEQARRRVRADSPLKLAARLLRRRGGEGRVFWYPRRGFGQLWERLAEAAADAGADIRLRTTASTVEADRHGVRVTAADGSVVDGSVVWSTVPMPVLARLAGAPADVLGAAEELRFRAMALVYLVLSRDRYTPFDAHYLPGPQTPVTRISEPKNYRDGDDPPDRTVLCAEIPCDPGDELWRSSDDDLVSVVREALASGGLPGAEPSGSRVVRVPSVYPVYRAGYERAFEVLDSWAASRPRLLSFGRQGLFAHDNSHHALAMAWAAAETLDDPGSWASARRRFAEHVVED